MLHGARLVHFVGKKEKVTKSGYNFIRYTVLYKITSFVIFYNYFVVVAFLVANSMYVFVRVATLAIATLVFLYGLGQVQSVFNFATGNFNIPVIRFIALTYIIIFQTYLSYVFISRQLKRARENVVPIQATVKSKQKPRKKEGKQDLRSFRIVNVH